MSSSSSPKYAKDQPAGFRNHIQNVAIVGAAGQQGSRITASLLEKGTFHVTALTRADSKSTMPAGVTSKVIDYADEAGIVEALLGVEVLIITMFARAPPSQQEALIRAAAKARVPYIMPNQWGPDFSGKLVDDVPLLGTAGAATRRLIEELGVSSWLVTICGFWYDYSLGVPTAYGFDLANKTVTFFDDGERKVNTSTWEQVGRGVAALLSLKRLPEDAHDQDPAVLQRFCNAPARIASFRVSQRDMLDSVLRVTGESRADWTVTHEKVEERWQRSFDAFKQGNFPALVPTMYSRTFFPDGQADFETEHGLQNELLGLPKEDLDTFTKRAVDLARNQQA